MFCFKLFLYFWSTSNCKYWVKCAMWISYFYFYQFQVDIQTKWMKYLYLKQKYAEFWWMFWSIESLSVNESPTQQAIFTLWPTWSYKQEACRGMYMWDTLYCLIIMQTAFNKQLNTTIIEYYIRIIVYSVDCVLSYESVSLKKTEVKIAIMWYTRLSCCWPPQGEGSVILIHYVNPLCTNDSLRAILLML